MVYVNTFAGSEKQQIRFESHSVKKLSHFETVIIWSNIHLMFLCKFQKW